MKEAAELYDRGARADIATDGCDTAMHDSDFAAARPFIYPK